MNRFFLILGLFTISVARYPCRSGWHLVGSLTRLRFRAMQVRLHLMVSLFESPLISLLLSSA